MLYILSHLVGAARRLPLDKSDYINRIYPNDLSEKEIKIYIIIINLYRQNGLIRIIRTNFQPCRDWLRVSVIML